MKKLVFISALIFVFFIYNASGFADSSDSSGDKTEYQLLISGVMGYANNKDMNASAENEAKFQAEALNFYYYGINYPYKINSKKANLPVGVDIDFRLFSDNIGIGLQVGYHTAKAESEVSSASFPDKDRIDITYELSVVPIVGTLFYRMNFESSNSFVLFGGGIGYYFGLMTVDFKWQNNMYGLAGMDSNDGTRTVIGLHALIEYDYVFDMGFTIFGGIKARYVRFDEFDKDEKFYIADSNWEKIKANLTGVAAYIGAGYSF
ncbi:MAG: hypothetical protein FWF73_01985 [Spirochaetes bacterium]|nr:hypothetical protein [Spirochaetota bacterium]